MHEDSARVDTLLRQQAAIARFGGFALRQSDLLLLFIGSVIGSGIFLTPGLILRQLNGSVGFSLLVWVVGGVLSLLGALTYAELSATNPEAGGLYCFIRDGFGRMAAFLYGWSLFLVIASGTIAALARAFTRYLAEIIPLSATGATFVSVLMIAVVTAVNVWGTRKSSDLQNWTTLVKTLLIVVLSGFLLSLGHHGGELASAMGTPQEGSALLSSFGLAMIAVLWAYEGWQFGTYSAGEVIDPPRSRERSFCCGAGGGLAFLGEEKGDRVSHNRAKELVATGAEVVGAACPFCNTMFRDALSAVSEAPPKLLDIAQIAAASLPKG